VGACVQQTGRLNKEREQVHVLMPAWEKRRAYILLCHIHEALDQAPAGGIMVALFHYLQGGQPSCRLTYMIALAQECYELCYFLIVLCIVPFPYSAMYCAISV
jgi:hypothetical protein